MVLNVPIKQMKTRVYAAPAVKGLSGAEFEAVCADQTEIKK